MYPAGVHENVVSGGGHYDCPCSTGSVQTVLQLLVTTTSVSLVVQGMFFTARSIPIVCRRVSSVEQLREGVVELLVYHGSTRHYPLPPVTTLN